jgi:hypothetical protein
MFINEGYRFLIGKMGIGVPLLPFVILFDITYFYIYSARFLCIL